MPPDFSRDVRFVLGLPFDAVDVSQTEERLRGAIAGRTRCFLSTPNLNFAVSCLTDAAFRSAVLQSDLSVADGFPLVVVSRLIGAALPERVSGSTLFDRLAASPRRPTVAVYFFGGPDGAARAACERLNADRIGGVTCAGFDAPGFGSVAEMSGAARLERINRARPDFVVVAVGAKKGQAWIQHNLASIEAPVIGYLGAVVNFVAGAVSRAPQWVQAARLEWLWRIKEEPGLWRRYAGDGWALIRLLATRVLPLAVTARLAPPSAAERARARVSRVETPHGATLQLAGAWVHENAGPLRAAFAQQAARQQATALDLGGVSHLDSAAIALIALLCGWQLKIGAGWELVNVPPTLRTVFYRACGEYLLEPKGTR